MKKAVTIFILFISFLPHAQAQEAKKFQAGFNYSLTDDDDLYNKPFSGYVNYQIKAWEDIGLHAGFRAFYYYPKIKDNFTDKWGFNPNISASYSFFEKKLQANLAVGYYFDSFKIEYFNINFDQLRQSKTIKANGFTISPGIKYFVTKTFFIDSNLTILSVKNKSEFVYSESSDFVFFNIGVGVAF